MIEDSVKAFFKRIIYLLETGVSVVSGLSIAKHDYMSYSLTNPTTEVFTYKVGGVDGTVVNTVTIVYTDSTRETVSSVTKT